MIKSINNKPIESYLNDIPFDRYITRRELQVLWGTGDRSVRDIINKIRKASPKYVIISSSSQKGYKRPSSYAEIEKCIAECEARIKEESMKKKQMEKLLKNRDQMGLGIAI